MSAAPSLKNPFPGLRAFTPEEDYLFFGREEQTLELLQRLAAHRFVAVVGTSGSGKSSLVRCGLLSELLGGRMLDAGSSWEIAVTHPGGNPLALLTDALLDADLYDRHVEHARENLLATLSRSHFGLVEAVKQAGLAAGTNFLLVVDQFEEIFRFQDAGQRQQEVANEFVSLLLEAVTQPDVPIYVVLTMRSDFIGECGQFEGLAEMVNRGEFLIPRLNREQYKRVIEGPIKVAGGKIAPRLLQRLLNDLGQQTDQLPCLQHALMRTWTVWAQQGDSDALDLDHYQRVGKMSQALSLHADEVYESLPGDRARELCRGVFQALTVEETNHRGIRRPQRLGRLCQILEVPVAELTPIIDVFRQSGVTFLMPSPEVELTEQTIIDISHESLMRVWTRLRHWVQEESQAVGVYRRLAESAGLHAEGKAGLYRDPELGIALAWRGEKRPNQAWAERYRTGFDQAMQFLEQSHQAQLSAEREQDAARRRELEQARRLAEAEGKRAELEQRAARRLRGMVAVLGAVAVFAGGASLIALRFWHDADEAKQVAQYSEQAARESAEAAQREATRATAQETAATEARRDAEDSLTRARTAIDEFLVQVSDSKLLSTPGLQPLRAELLESAGKFYSEFLTKNPDDPRLQAGLADAFYRVGSVNGDLGRNDQALVALDKAIELRSAALEARPGDEELRHRLAQAWYQCGFVRVKNLQIAEADEAARESARIWDELVKEHPENIEYRKSLARACNTLGNTAGQLNQFERAFLAYQRSMQIRLELLEHHPQDLEVVHGLSESFNNIALQFTDSDQHIRLTQRANEYGLIAHRLSPQNVEYASDLAIGYFGLSRLQYVSERKAESLASFRSGIEHCLRFIRANPAVPDLRDRLKTLLVYLRYYSFDAALADEYVGIFRNVRSTYAELPRITADDHITWAYVQADCAQQVVRARKTFQNRALPPNEESDVAAWRAGSMASLREAVALGITGVERLRDPLLGDLRNQADHQALIAKILAGESFEPPGGVAGTAATVTNPAIDPKTQIIQDRAFGFLAYGIGEGMFQQSRRAEKSLEHALELRQSLVDADPENLSKLLHVIEVRHAQARQYQSTRELAKARDLFERNVAALEQAQGRDATAAESLQLAKLVEIVEREYADFLAQAGLWDEAAPRYAKAIRRRWELLGLKRNANLPSAFAADREFEEALLPVLELLESPATAYAEACQQALSKAPTGLNSDLSARLARRCVLRPNAVPNLARVLALTETSQNTWHAHARGLVLYRMGRFEEAIRVIQTAQQRKHLEGVGVEDFVAAMAFFQTGRHEEAKQLLSRMHDKTPRSMSDWTHNPGNMLDVDWLVLRREANELIHGSPYSSSDRIRRGESYVRLGAPDLAIVEFATGLAQLTDFPLGHFQYAQALAMAGRASEAEPVLEKARQLREQQRNMDATCWQMEAETLKLLGQHEASLIARRRAVTVQSLQVLELPQAFVPRWQSLRLHDELADALQALGRDAEAKSVRFERELLFTAFDIPPVYESISAVFTEKTSREARIAASLAAIEQLLVPNRPYMAAADVVSRTLRGRLHLRRGILLHEAQRGREAVADLARAREIFEELLRLEGQPTEYALALAEILDAQRSLSWTPIVPIEMKTENGTRLTRMDDGSILAVGVNPPHDLYTIVANIGTEPVAAVRLEALVDKSLPYRGPGRNSYGGFVMDRFELSSAPIARPKQTSPVTFERVRADYFLAEQPIDPQTGRWHIGGAEGRSHVFVAQTGSSVVDPNGLRLTFRLTFNHGPVWPGNNLGRFRLSFTSDSSACETEQRRWNTTGFVEPWSKLGAAYALQAQPSRAIDAFLTSLERATSSEMRLERAKQIAAVLVADAMLVDELRSRENPQPLLLVAVANQLSERGQIDEARALLKRTVGFLEQQLDSAPTDLVWQQSLADALLELSGPKWTVLTPLEMRADGDEKFQVEPDGSLFVSGPASDRAIYELTMQSMLPKITAMRLDTIPDERLPHQGSGRYFGNGNFHLSEFTAARVARAADAPPIPFSFTRVIADEQQEAIYRILDNDPTTKWETYPKQQQRHWIMLGLETPEPLEDGRIHVTIDSGIADYKQHGLGRFRLSATDQPHVVLIERQRLAARNLTDSRLKLGLAYAHSGQSDKAFKLMFSAFAAESESDSVTRTSLGKQIAAALPLSDEVLHELVRRDDAPPLLMLEVARVLEDRSDLERAVGIRKRARLLCETMLAQTPDDDELQGIWAELLLADRRVPSTTLAPVEMTSSEGTTLKLLADRSLLASGKVPDGDVYTLVFKQLPPRFQALRLEVLPDESLPANGPGRAHNGNFVLAGMQVTFAPDGQSSPRELPITRVAASHEQPANAADSRSYPLASAVDGDSMTGWAVSPLLGQSHTALFALPSQIAAGAGSSLTISLSQGGYVPKHTMGRLRWSAFESQAEFEREARRLAAQRLPIGWMKLAAAHALHDEPRRALDLFEKHPAELRNALVKWIDAGLPLDRMLDELKDRIPAAYAAELPAVANHASERGEVALARTLYLRLQQLQPKNELWTERLAQLQPGTLAIWNFDAGSSGWDEARNCELTVKNGVLTMRETSPDPHFFTRSVPPVAANVLVVRYRHEQVFGMEYYVGDARRDIYESSGTGLSSVPGTQGEWRELALPLSYAAPLKSLRLDFNLGNGASIDIDSIALRQVDSVEHARLLRDVVVEPELARLTREIEAAPTSSEKYSARADFLMRLGRWSEARKDCYQERTLTPTNRAGWFKEATCLLMAGDDAGHQKLCREMLAQFRETSDSGAADSVCKICLLRPGTIPPADLPISLVRDTLVDPTQNPVFHWFVGVSALHYYRGGQFEEALASAKKHPNFQGQSGALALVVQALAEHQLGQHEQARKTLAKAEASIPWDLRTLGTPQDETPRPVSLDSISPDWLAPEIVRREAARLIASPARNAPVP